MADKRITKYKGRLVSSMSREELVAALTDCALQNQRLAATTTQIIGRDKIDAVFEAFEPGWKKISDLFASVKKRKGLF